MSAPSLHPSRVHGPRDYDDLVSLLACLEAGPSLTLEYSMRPMTTDLNRGDRRPYFLWDEDVSIDELRAALAGNQGPEERLRLLGKLLREARDTDVWEFVAPQDVARALPDLRRRLGRRRRFWEFLIEGWRQDGILKD